MPLKLFPPQEGRSPYWTIRGTHIGQRIFRSAKTTDRRVAAQILKKLERDIERGSVSDKPALTFAAAALAYLRNGGESRFVRPLSDYFKGVPLERIDQLAIDEAAASLYPGATPGTRNRQVYTPVSAILKHAGVERMLKRPKGHAKPTTAKAMTREEAPRLFGACEDAEFQALLIVLVYTGLRLSEALSLEWRDIDLGEASAYVRHTKNGQPRACHLPPEALAALANLPGREGRVFRYRKNGHLYNTLKAAKKAAKLSWVTFHTCRHTYATWMRRYAGMDTRGLVGTGAWKSEKSAARYTHTTVTEESRKADLLPASGTVLVRSNKK
jgi:integrase